MCVGGGYSQPINAHICQHVLSFLCVRGDNRWATECVFGVINTSFSIFTQRNSCLLSTRFNLLPELYFPDSLAMTAKSSTPTLTDSEPLTWVKFNRHSYWFYSYCFLWIISLFEHKSHPDRLLFPYDRHTSDWGGGLALVSVAVKLTCRHKITVLTFKIRHPVSALTVYFFRDLHEMSDKCVTCWSVKGRANVKRCLMSW